MHSLILVINSLGVEFVDDIRHEGRRNLLLQQLIEVDGFKERTAHDIPV